MKSVRVLVAEDNEDHRFFILRALREVEGVNFQIEVVKDGAETLDFLFRRGRFDKQARPHLILLDLKMPKVDGLEVIEAIKSDHELRKIPIAVLTSSDRKEDVDAAYTLGTNSYVIKPISLTDLQNDLQEVSSYWTGVSILPDPPS